jgi:hypothetical protein
MKVLAIALLVAAAVVLGDAIVAHRYGICLFGINLK